MKEKIIRAKNIKGDVIFDGKVIFKNDCVVEGSIRARTIIAEQSIEAGGSIEAGRYIKADASIEAGGYIKAGWSIEAGRYIKADASIEAGGYIKAGWSIEAGGSIKAGGSIFSFIFDIQAKNLTTKTLPFYRKYWAEMPPLKKWRDKILDESLCWDDYRNEMITKAEAEKICKWNGWHPLLRAHLEMFFGLKDKVML